MYLQKQPSRGVNRKRWSENIQQIYRRTEAVVQKCSVGKVLLEIYRKKTCARISFLIKLQVWACNFIKKEALACNFVKKETLAQVFSSEFYEISKNTFFCRTAPVAASEENEQPCKSVISSEQLWTTASVTLYLPISNQRSL